MASRADLSEYSNADIYGHCYIPRDHFESVMESIGFEKVRSNHRLESSALTFRGEMFGIKAVFHCSTYFHGDDKFYMVQSVNPTECKVFTHYHVKQWMPSNVQLSGKGSRTQGWEICYKLVELLEPDDNDDISYADCDLGV